MSRGADRSPRATDAASPEGCVRCAARVIAEGECRSASLDCPSRLDGRSRRRVSKGVPEEPADYPFLPAWPPALTPLAWVAVLLLTAIVVGEATRRWLRISRVVGYLLVGAVLGPHATGVIGADTLATLRIFSDIAVGLLLFELGQRVDLGWLAAIHGCSSPACSRRC